MGLATAAGPGQWLIDLGAEPTLRDLGMRGDIIKTMHRALRRDANLDLPQIAIILGYANQSSFGVAFNREIGLTPIQWRKREAV